MDLIPDTLIACGGGGRSPFWRQMLADILKCKVTTIASKEGPALGAAILAAVAAGLYPTVEDAVDHLVKAGAEHAEPQCAETERSDAIYELYQSLYPTLRPAFHKLATLRAKLDGEKVEPYKSVFSVEFERFGKVLPNVDGAKVSELLQKLPCPSDSVTYVPSEPVLETPELMADMQDRVYGGLPIQIGYCSGHSRTLNALEYHRNSEVNITGTDTLFMLAPMSAIKDGIADTQAVETFFAPKGTAVLFYETTLHYAPSHISEADGFRVAVVLPRGTNTEKPAHIDAKGDAEPGYLTANNKWLLAHKDSPEGRGQISTGKLVGANITLTK